MALFKILSNMVIDNKNPTPPDPYGCINGVEDEHLAQVRSNAEDLPNTFNQGFCYFDRSTGKFWIDTTHTTATVTLTDKNDNTNPYVQGRIPINAYYADLAELAVAATHDDKKNEIIDYYAHDFLIENDQLWLRNGNGDKIPGAVAQLGSGVTIYKWSST